MVLILDGAIGTELKARGCQLDPILWSVGVLATDPDAVFQLHCDYLKHGADIITTNTYQISIESFQTHWNFSKEETIEKICNRALKVAFDAKHSFKNKKIALSMSTFGANVYVEGIGAQEFKGDYVNGSIPNINQQMYEFHEQKLQIFLDYCEKVNEYPDYILFETVPVLQEAKIITKLLKEKFASKIEHRIAVIISFSCKNEQETNHGESIADCANFLASHFPLIQGMGINCTKPRYVFSLVTTARSNLHSQQQMWCYPNSGEEWNHDEQDWEKKGEDELETCIQQLFDANCCQVLGGCCRSSVHTIEVISSRFKKNI